MNVPRNTPPPRSLWHNNFIQFPRLLAEIVATVEISDENWQELCDSMDLNTHEINELLDRAQVEWERIKQGEQPQQETPYRDLVRFREKF